LIYNNPSDLNVNNHNIISGLWYFKKNVLDKITIDANTSADKVTQKVNKYTTKGSYAERRNYLTKAKQYITCK